MIKSNKLPRKKTQKIGTFSSTFKKDGLADTTTGDTTTTVSSSITSTHIFNK